uniref:HMA domain-containing protein n=1 Tax=Ananas comosus var. bracteatus TaxID=296719 RepID=A0A6V7P2Y8_ANACO|nr:unnamed protein product [Ananas comosus var. bracteatus]
MSEQKPNAKKEILVELKVYMHCKACESLVFNTLKHSKGVETVKVDMNAHKAILTGQFEVEKILKKLRKKTGKRGEILNKIERNVDGEKDDSNPVTKDNCDDNAITKQYMTMCYDDLDDSEEENFHMFNDENANACQIV